MILLEHQNSLLSKNPNKRLLVWSTGTGKTGASLLWAKQKKGSVLIICPKALKTNWSREIIKWGFTGKYEVISKEEFRRDWQKLNKFKSIIVDEIHYFAGPKSQLTKALLKYIKIHDIRYILGLTATPYMSSPMNIHTLGRHMGQTGYKWSYPYFMQSYFNLVRMGSRMIPVIRKDAPEKMAKKIAEIADVVSLSDCVDVPDSTFEAEFFSLTKEQEKGIKDIKDINFISRWTKTHQICGGTLKEDDYNPAKFYKNDKIDRIIELAKDNPKLIVVCRYNHEIDYIYEELMNVKKTFIINGAVKDKQSVLDEANKSEECVLLVNAACAEGWEAPTFNTMVFYSLDFSLKNLVQMFGRIQRINALQKCAYVFLVIEKSIDADVYQSVVIKKQDFQIAIYENSQP